jgi:hypothetical protein
MIAFAAERLMEIEVGALTGGGHGEKSAARLVRAPKADDLSKAFESFESARWRAARYALGDALTPAATCRPVRWARLRRCPILGVRKIRQQQPKFGNPGQALNRHHP